MAAWTEAKPSLWPGRCQWENCPIDGGRFVKGDLIRWSRKKGDKGVTYHDRCHPDNRDGQWDNRRMAEPAVNRGQGGIFEAADEAERDAAMAIPPVHVNGVNLSRSGRMAGAPGNLDPMAVLATALLPHLEGRIGGGVDPEEVLALIEQHLNGALLKTVVSVEVYDHAAQDIRDLGLQHFQYPKLLLLCKASLGKRGEINIWLTGPAGSGKTTAARNCAVALDLPFGFCGAIDNPYGLLGFIDATGNYRRTAFREIWENGGIWLMDEVDGSTAAALLPLNAGFANGIMAFPDGAIPKSHKCVIIAAANTWGMGATSDYVGRMKLDAATLDRFVPLYWGYDEALELATAGNPAWVNRVQALRKNAVSKGLKVMITPRASYYGSSLLAAGMEQSEVEALTVRKGMSDSQWAMIGGTI